MSENVLEPILARIPERWGKYVSCDEGWYPIILNLDTELAALDPDYVIHQVKEKFGGLRYYTHTELEDQTAFYALITEAEKLSFQTCELCASMKDVTTSQPDGWLIKTLCSKCLTKAKAKNSKGKDSG